MLFAKVFRGFFGALQLGLQLLISFLTEIGARAFLRVRAPAQSSDSTNSLTIDSVSFGRVWDQCLRR